MNFRVVILLPNVLNKIFFRKDVTLIRNKKLQKIQKNKLVFEINFTERSFNNCMIVEIKNKISARVCTRIDID